MFAFNVRKLMTRVLGRKTTAPIRKAPARLGCEPLEARECPAYISGGSLVVDGTAGNDVVTVTYRGGSSNPLYSLSPRVTVNENGWVQNFYLTQITGGQIVLRGNAGNDTLNASGVPLRVVAYGGSGSDTITGGSVNDVLAGDGGNDYLYGGGGDDTIYGNDGDDLAWGGNGNDAVYGGWGADTLAGDAGNDYVRGEGGSDQVYGNDGNDTLYGDNAGNPWGGESGDQLFGGWGDDTLIGEGGNDYLRGEGGSDVLYGNDGDDQMYGDNAGNPWGGDGNDQMYGGWGNDTMAGEGGDDYLRGEGGSDELYGNDGDDTLYGDNAGNPWGGEAADSLFGGWGNDTLIGEGGGDYLAGEGGDDRIDAGSGGDRVLGGSGDDFLITGIGNPDRDGPAEWESVDPGTGTNMTVKTVQTVMEYADQAVEYGEEALETVNGIVELLDTMGGPQKSIPVAQQLEMFREIFKDGVQYVQENYDRMKNGEIPASEVVGHLYSMAAGIIVGTTCPALKWPAMQLAEQYGKFYGDMFSDLVDIIKGQEPGSVGETVGKLAAATFYASGAGAVLLTPTLAFGVDGWEFVKGLAADLGGAIEDAVNEVVGVLDSLWDDVVDVGGDVVDGITDVFGI